LISIRIRLEEVHKGRVPTGSRPDSILFYLRRFVTAFLALST
jgi:hypothetical protein